MRTTVSAFVFPIPGIRLFEQLANAPQTCYFEEYYMAHKLRLYSTTMKQQRLIDRVLVFGLAGLFTLFNVGIPVIVASCPMTPAEGQVSCNACVVPSGNHVDSLLPRTDTSCCTTVFAAAPADVSFLKISVTPIDAESMLAPMMMLSIGDHVSLHQMTRIVLGHRRASSDLPVLFSSLLI